MLLIVGLDHSGTTILDLALGVSPQVQGIGEALRMCNPGAAVGSMSRLCEGRAAEVTCSCGGTGAECPMWSRVTPRPFAEVSIETSFPELVAMARALRPETRFVLDSSPSGWTHLHQLRGFELWVVHLTRDVRSWTHSKRRRRGTGLAAAHWIWFRDSRLIEHQVARHADHSIAVGYEELALRPRETLQRICDWAGVAFDARMLTPGGHTGSHVLVGNAVSRSGSGAREIRYDGGWMAQAEAPLWQGLLHAACARRNRRLVYSNGIVRRRA
ncbi:sulfotransferase [Salipiger sp. HF18]|uniref:sulfotransferase family protein n=1 Tax=Salipiger sp. HF18 TaxID=2721557 RepID=UPI00142DCC4A|nr:sulfotransferase [Salipiger sp. HF18]NIY95167.1 sulfotransferase [Salipiger sp. HF18]